MTTRWLLLEPDEDGNPTRWLTEEELEELLEDAEEQGITRWVTPETWRDKDPNYWKSGDAMLLEVTVHVPKEVTKKWSLD